MNRKSPLARVLSSTALYVLVSAAMGAAGLYAAASGEMGWSPGIFFVVCALVLCLGFFDIKPFAETLEVSDWGVRRTFGPKFRRKQVEEVAWGDLALVEVITTDDGPYAEDMFFMLHGANSKGVVVSNDLAVTHDLVMQLQKRLAGFDNLALVKASGLTESGSFLLWQKLSSPKKS
jgi:hypothetical protein